MSVLAPTDLHPHVYPGGQYGRLWHCNRRQRSRRQTCPNLLMWFMNQLGQRQRHCVCVSACLLACVCACVECVCVCVLLVCVHVCVCVRMRVCVRERALKAEGKVMLSLLRCVIGQCQVSSVHDATLVRLSLHSLLHHSKLLFNVNQACLCVPNRSLFPHSLFPYVVFII